LFFFPPIFLTIAAVAVLGLLWYSGRFFSFTRFSNRQKNAAIVLTYVREAMRLNLPIPAFVRAGALGETGRVRDALFELESLLTHGAELSEALIATLTLPARAIDLLRAAARTGQLSQTLSQLTAETRTKLSEDPSSPAFVRWYPAVLLLAISLVLWLIATLVLPRYTYILHDFGMAIPRSTLIVQSLSTVAAAVAFILIFAMIFFIELPRAMGVPRDGAPLRLPFLSTVMSRFPFVGRARHDRAMADMLGVMADSLASGRPIDAALADAHAIRSDAALQYRFSKWSDAISSGMPIPQAAAAARLPRLLVSTLALAAPTNNLPDALRFLARWYRSRFSRTVILLRAVTVPAVVIAMGCLVALTSLALFEPLIGLIDVLSQTRPGL
jgi:type II secretory pathway component PulF